MEALYERIADLIHFGAVAEAVGVAVALVAGFHIHRRLVHDMGSEFAQYAQRLTNVRESLYAINDKLAAEKKHFERLMYQTAEKLSTAECEVSELEDEIESLEAEIERLKNPELVAVKREAETRQAGEKAILGHLAKSQWVREGRS